MGGGGGGSSTGALVEFVESLSMSDHTLFLFQNKWGQGGMFLPPCWSNRKAWLGGPGVTVIL